MSKIVVAHKTQGALYSFDTDPGLGVIGTRGLGIFIPKNSIIKRCEAKSLITFLSGGAATIALSLIGLLSTEVLFVPTGFAAFIAGNVLQGVDFNANPVTFADTPELIMDIAGANITAGSFIITIDYEEMLM